MVSTVPEQKVGDNATAGLDRDSYTIRVITTNCLDMTFNVFYPSSIVLSLRQIITLPLHVNAVLANLTSVRLDCFTMYTYCASLRVGKEFATSLIKLCLFFLLEGFKANTELVKGA